MADYYFNLPSGKALAVSGHWLKGHPGGYWEPPEPAEFEVDRVEVWDGETLKPAVLSDAEWEELQPLLDKLMEQANTDPHFFGDD